MTRPRRRAALLAAITVLSAAPIAALGSATASAATGDPVLLNEVLASHTGTDDTEYVELYGTPGTSLEGLSFIGVESDASTTNGRIDHRYDFAAGDEIGTNGFFLLGNPAGLSANYAVTPDADVGDNFLENSSTTYALVETASLSGTNVTGSEVVLDAVGSTDGESASSFAFGAAVIGPDGSFFPAGLRRVTDGIDTDAVSDWVIADFSLGTANTPTAATDGGEPEPTTPCQALEGTIPIGTVQGAGADTPCAGDRVTVEGVVVGDYEGGSGTLRGFYVQDAGDGDPATSDGIFVFNGSSDSVNLGDVVTVEGTAGEFQGQTQLSDFAEITVASNGPLPAPAIASLPLSSPDGLERFEGMYVTVPQTLYATEFFQLGRFGQVVVSSGDRLDQPTAVAEPGAGAQSVQAANDLNRLILDDALQVQNPDPVIISRDGVELTAENTLRGGDTITGATGVLTYTWAGNSASGNAYRLRPPSPAVGTFDFDATNPRPAGAPEVGGELEVVSFNVLNYFLSLDDGDPTCGPEQDMDCRGAESPLEHERQRTKLLAALAEVDADIFGLVELENTTGVSPEQDIADGLNGIFGAGTYAAVDAGTVGTDAIRVGIVYKPASVTPLGEPAQLDYSLDPLGEPRSRSALAQSFVDADGEVVTVVVNHLKSKGDSGLAGTTCVTTPTYPDCDQGDGQGYFNATRTEHAQELVDWLATEPTGTTDDDVLLLGDYNAYAMEDPIDVLRNAGYADLEATLQEDGEPYGYVFDGQWGRLDYAFASPSLIPQVTGAETWHINADEPNVLDYNTNFKSSSQVEELYAPDEFRTSDHDPVVVGLSLASGLDARVTDDELWPPNHKLVGVAVDGYGDAVTVLGATSSEADSGLGPDDVPDDIGTPDGDTIALRAERFSHSGRIYTVDVVVTDGGQVRYVEAAVTVPHSRGRGPR